MRTIRLFLFPGALVLAIGAFVGCSGLGGSKNDEAGTPPPFGASAGGAAGARLLQGKVLLQSIMFIPEPVRPSIVANSAAIAAAGHGHTVAADGSTVTYPTVPAAGWFAKLGSQQVMADTQGIFTVSVPPGSPTQGQICSPYDTTTAYVTFSTSQLVPAGQTPPAITVQAAVQGLCCMTPGDVRPGCDCTTSAASRVNRPQATIKRAGLLGDPSYVVGPLGSYPTGRDGLSCGQLNGIQLSTNTGFEAMISYFGSTCDDRVWQDCCVGEGSPLNMILSFGGKVTVFVNPKPCYLVHKGRVCQELVPGDFAVKLPLSTCSALPGGPATCTQAVNCGSSVPVIVHNNGCTGETIVTKIQDGCHGTLTGANLSGNLLKHYDATKLAASGGTRQDNSIYQADQNLTYALPATPCPNSQDVYTFQTDGTTLTATFTCQSPPTSSGGSVTTTTTSISASHTVGVTSCPQTLGSIPLQNGTGSTVSFSASSNSSFITLTNASGSIPAGSSATIGVSFNCGQQPPLSATITINVNGQTLTVPVTLTRGGTFALSPNPVTVTGSFSNGTGGCNTPASFTDTLTISVSGSTITINQPSTGDRNTGTINPDGTFSASQANPSESYVGTLQSNGAGTAVNRYTDSNNCTSTWQVAFTPRTSGQPTLRASANPSLAFKRQRLRK